MFLMSTMSNMYPRYLKVLQLIYIKKRGLKKFINYFLLVHVLNESTKKVII